MKDVVLVDAQAARVRRFREAVALYRDSFRPLRSQGETVRQEARAIRKRAQKIRATAAAGRRSAEPEEVRLHVFPSAAEALKFLRREAPYGWAPRPAVVFTDLYLDDKGGSSFVDSLKRDPELRDVPAVILCSGAAHPREEVRRAWEVGCNAVIDLPWDGDGGLAKVRDVLRFWLVQAATPPPSVPWLDTSAGAVKAPAPSALG